LALCRRGKRENKGTESRGGGDRSNPFREERTETVKGREATGGKREERGLTYDQNSTLINKYSLHKKKRRKTLAFSQRIQTRRGERFLDGRDQKRGHTTGPLGSQRRHLFLDRRGDLVATSEEGEKASRKDASQKKGSTLKGV